ncbi:MAG: helix-hairpin-helix domain-containing protein, partial [Planctomycetota bacterium]
MSPARSFILIGVLVVIMLGIAVSGSLLLLAEWSRSDSDIATGRLHARLAGSSALRVLVSEADASRAALLQGGVPDLSEEGALFTTTRGDRAEFRLLDLGGVTVRSEQAKLDINHATAEMLGALDGLPASVAAEIVEARKAGRFGSLDALLKINGVTNAMLYGSTRDGSIDSGTADDDAGLGGAGLGGAGLGGAGLGGAGLEDPNGAAAPLCDSLTVMSFDPVVTSGIDNRAIGLTSLGDARINLGEPWSDTLRDEIEERFTPEIAQQMERAVEQAGPPEDAAGLARLVRDELDLEVTGWSGVLAGFTTTTKPFELGRVDINRAPKRVLVCLPGISEQIADEIVAARDTLPPDQLARVAWVVEEGIVSETDFVEVFPWITTRSMQWRVRLEVGLRPPGETPEDDFGLGDAFDDDLVPLAGDAAADAFGVPVDVDEASALRDRLVYDIVLDTSGDTTRIAELTDITLAGVARMLARRS